jgi:hypothetical protein
MPAPGTGRLQRLGIPGRGPERFALAKAVMRCTDTTHPSYPAYGGRGIRVCDAWIGPNGFAPFYQHMGPRPGPDFSLDRIDNDGNYEPGNVRWATHATQSNNQRRNVRLSWRGETLTAAQWSRRTGLSRFLIAWRKRAGWTDEAVLTTPDWSHRYATASEAKAVTVDDSGDGGSDENP